MTGHIRMQSFVWSLWATTAFCAFGILFIFGLSYLYFTYLAVFLMPIVYIAKFNLAMRKIRRVEIARYFGKPTDSIFQLDELD